LLRSCTNLNAGTGPPYFGNDNQVYEHNGLISQTINILWSRPHDAFV
jgi:hypothetical protein